MYWPDLAAWRVSEGAAWLGLRDCPRLVARVLQHHPHLWHDEVELREVASPPLGENGNSVDVNLKVISSLDKWWLPTYVFLALTGAQGVARHCDKLSRAHNLCLSGLNVQAVLLFLYQISLSSLSALSQAHTLSDRRSLK